MLLSQQSRGNYTERCTDQLALQLQKWKGYSLNKSKQNLYTYIHIQSRHLHQTVDIYQVQTDIILFTSE